MPTLDDAYERLNVEVDLIPAGASNRPGTPITPTFITIHNTANPAPGADARMHARYLKGSDARARKVSWHFTVDDVRCVKHLPTNEKGWHAGPGNSQSIGIEICEQAGIDLPAALDRAGLLTAVLMSVLDVPRERIVPHQQWTGKDCPRQVLRLEGGFDAFRSRAGAFLDELRAPAGPATLGIALGAPSGAPLGATFGATPAPGDGATVTHLVDPAPSLAARDAYAAGVARGGTPPGGDDRVAQLERLVGQLVLENRELRRAVADAQEALYQTD